MSVRTGTVFLLRRLGLEPFARLAVSTPRAVTRMVARFAASARRISVAWPSEARRHLVERRAFHAYRKLVSRSPHLDLLAGERHDQGVAVIVCLWNRPDRIGDVLRILRSQQSPRPVRLVLWNNQPKDSLHYRRAISDHSISGALSSIEFYDAPTNIGGIGRFVAARELVSRGYSDAFIMMDDDQDFGPTFVSDLLEVSAPHSVAGVWAWTNDGAYWNRKQLETTGGSADHVGTGGSVCDSAIVADPQFFLAIPPGYLFMEDMWMSRYASHNGWPLTMVESPFTFVLSELDQGHALFDRKELFYNWMTQPGHVPARPSALG
ncbi:MAG: hypothetical protein H7279_04680 [Microbacteriaceae bacterium]|nr:hypothetical protein [Microbacteriaceae bacterium]